MANGSNFCRERAKFAVIARSGKVYKRCRRTKRKGALLAKKCAPMHFLVGGLVMPEKTGDSFERRVHALWRLVIQNGN